MRIGAIVGAWLVCFVASGCIPSQLRMPDVAGSLSRWRPKPPVMRPDVVELYYIFLTADADDADIDEDVWEKEVDEQCISLDAKAALAENGMRLGKLGSRLSPSVLELLKENEQNQSGRYNLASSGQLAKVQLTEILPTWSVFQSVNGQAAGDELRDAQGFLYIKPTITGDLTTSLEISPEIEFGPRRQKRVPTADLAGWQLRTERDSRSFPRLKATVHLADGEYVLIGAGPDRGATLGRKMFLREEGGVRKQTLLLIRVARPNREQLLTAGYDFDDFFLTPIRRTARARTTPVLETLLAAREVEMKGVR